MRQTNPEQSEQLRGRVRRLGEGGRLVRQALERIARGRMVFRRPSRRATTSVPKRKGGARPARFAVSANAFACGWSPSEATSPRRGPASSAEPPALRPARERLSRAREQLAQLPAGDGVVGAEGRRVVPEQRDLGGRPRRGLAASAPPVAISATARTGRRRRPIVPVHRLRPRPGTLGCRREAPDQTPAERRDRRGDPQRASSK